MNKFKKMMSVTLASCMAASALMMSAGAANTPVDTGTATLAPNVISNTTINQLKATAQNAIEQFSVRAIKTFTRSLASASMTVK